MAKVWPKKKILLKSLTDICRSCKCTRSSSCYALKLYLKSILLLTHTHTHTPFLSLSLSLSYTHTNTRTLSLSISLLHTRTFSLCNCKLQLERQMSKLLGATSHLVLRFAKRKENRLFINKVYVLSLCLKQMPRNCK